MFKRLHESLADPVTIDFEGEPVTAATGDSVAAALLAHGVGHLRDSVVTGAPRAPHCMIGACFECLVEIDGAPNLQACLVPVREGMRVRRQKGAAEVTP